MKRALGVLTLAGLAAVLGTPGGQGDEPPKRNPLMQQKLERSQKVLEGIAVKDFDLIEKNADELILISKKAEWRVLQTPDYVLHSDDFRRNADAIVKAARAKNLDGAALAYVQLTMSCVNCHKHVREVRMTRLEERPPDRAVTILDR
jgi:hypothetical protein